MDFVKIFNTFSSDNVYYSMQDTIIDICVAFYWMYEWSQNKLFFNPHFEIKITLSLKKIDKSLMLVYS